MRRQEREISDRAAIDAIIRACQVCRLGMVDGDLPYIVPMSFGYDGRALYFHCATQGRKLDVLRRRPRVCFEFDCLDAMVEAEQACGWSCRYRSVMGTGLASIIADPEGKRRALSALMAQYSERSFSFPDAALARTAAIEVVIESITGKRAG